MGRVVFEVGGGGIREEIAKEGTPPSPSMSLKTHPNSHFVPQPSV